MAVHRALASAGLEVFVVLVRSPSFAEGPFMRFNPPPNWPQPPAGWSPPPDWVPDPSWPQPPSDWPLWIADDETVVLPYRVAGSRGQSTQPWYRRTVSIVLLLIFFFPVGMVLLWLRPDWSLRRRGIITAITGLVVIIAVASSNPPPTATTALSPTAVGGTVSSSHAPASSQPAVPAPVVTKSRTPATSAPPKTTAAAPVHTVAAPVHTSAAPVYKPPAPAPTTKAPQPPAPAPTTAPAESCHPLTDSGKCYEPGEYCRDDDHGVSGIDADGDAIQCEDNDGWRWERS
jgi:hypothetical protein